MLSLTARGVRIPFPLLMLMTVTHAWSHTANSLWLYDYIYTGFFASIILIINTRDVSTFSKINIEQMGRNRSQLGT